MAARMWCWLSISVPSRSRAQSRRSPTRSLLEWLERIAAGRLVETEERPGALHVVVERRYDLQRPAAGAGNPDGAGVEMQLAADALDLEERLRPAVLAAAEDRSRSVEARVGKGGVSTCRSRWRQTSEKKKERGRNKTTN